MDPLTAFLMLAPAYVAPADSAGRIEQWRVFIDQASARFGIPADWIVRVMRAESGGRTMLEGRPITSRKGAMGLMQLMPATYAEMARRFALGADPYLPRDNILAGAAYLRLMYDRFGYPGLFAAYNAGPARYAAFLRNGKGLPDETKSYLVQVGQGVRRGSEGPASQGVSPAPAGLFFRLDRATGTIDSTPNSPPGRGLFVVRRDPELPPK